MKKLRIVLNLLLSFILCQNIFSGINFSGQTSKIFLQNGSTFDIQPTTGITGWAGTLTATSGSTMAGSTIAFNYGFLNNGATNETQIFGTLNSPSQQIVLGGNQVLINTKPITSSVSISNAGNLITGAGAVNGVISLTSNTSSFTWDIPERYTYGSVSLNGGRIRFTQNSGLGASYTFLTTGTIDLSNTTFQLGANPTSWHGNLYWIGNGGTIVLNDNVTIDGIWTLSGNLIIEGNNYLIDLAPTGSIILERGAQIEFRDISIYNMSRKNRITCSDNNCQVKLSITDFFINNNYLWDKGGLYVYYDSRIGLIDGLDGLYTFSYASTVTSTIGSDAFLRIAPGARFSIGRVNSTKTNINQQPLVFNDPLTSQLRLNGGTLHITSSGMIMASGTMKVENSSNIEIDNTSYPYGLILGDGTSSHDFEMEITPGVNCTLKSGRLFYNNYSPNRIIFDSFDSTLSINPQKGVYATRSFNINNGTIASPSPNDISFAWNTGKYIQTNNMQRDDYGHLSDFYITGTVNPPTLILDINNQILVNPGTVNRNILINQSNNLITGVGHISGSILFTNFNSTVTWDIPQPYTAGNINLNGGRIRYTQDSGIGPQYSFNGSGTIDLTTKKFELGSEATTWTGNFYWIGNGGIISLNNDISIDGTWTLSGNIIIDGNGYTMDLGTTGTLIFERGAQVVANNIAFYNLTRQNRIICKDNNCQLELNYVDMVLAGDYLWDKGSIYIYFDSIILPNSQGLDSTLTFSYTSSQPFSIDSDASIAIWPKIRFSTGRQNSTVINPTLQPIIFSNPKTSRIILNGGTLHLTSSGMIMTGGTMEAHDASNIEIENSAYPYGLILGNNTSSNDFLLDIEPGAQLTLNSGKLFYNNFSPNRIDFDSPESSLNIVPTNGLTAVTNLTLQNGTIYSPGTAVVPYSNSSVILSNIIRNFGSPYSIVTLSTHGVSPSYTLANGDSFYATQGYTIRNVIASSGSSTFGGAGEFGGTLSLKNNAVTLTSVLETPCFCNVPLNGGTLIYGVNSSFGNSNTLTGSGNVQFNGTSLSFGTQDINMTSSIYWQGVTSGQINLNSKIGLSSTWQFGGNMFINGNGNILDLSDGGILQIRPGATLTLDDIAIKGLGQNFGSINFMDKTGTLRLTNAYLELDNNLSTTIGGVLVSGPTTVGVKNYNWTLSQNASMTIDRVTLWQDPLGQVSYGKVRFGSGSIGKYLTLTSSATIKTATNLDFVISVTTSLQKQIRTNSNAFAYEIKNNSNTLLELNRTTSNALLFGDRNNSNALLTLNRTTSNALLFGDRNNSNAIAWLNMRVRTDSNAFLTLNRTTSNALLALNRTTSNALLLLNRTTSNALLFGDRNNSNAIAWLNMRVRTDSNTFLTLNRTTSNALLALNRTTSNALLLLNRTTSNALLFGDRNNSNAIIKLNQVTGELSIHNSNAIVSWVLQTSNTANWLSNTVRTDSNAFAFGIKNNSNTLLALNRANSNALLFGDRNNSNALLTLNRTTSNTLLFGDRNSSNAIITLNRTVRTNSNAFLYGIKNNSNTLLALNRANSNALLFGDRNNSNALLTLNRTTSNALLFGDRNSSNAIITLNRTVRTNSNAFAYGIKNNSNAIIKLNQVTGELSVNNSNAIIKLDRELRTDSNAFAYEIKNNSNAIVYLSQVTGELSIHNSNAIVSWVKSTSNTANYLADHFISVNNGTFYIINGINNGSTTLSGHSVIYKSIDLAGGTLTTNNGIDLDSETTINSSGNFNLQGNSIAMGGNLSIPNYSSITFVSNGIIDGQNNDLTLGAGSTIVVDNNVTLTLRNLGWLGQACTYPITMRSPTSKLILQNANLKFDRDFTFTQGQLFIQDDVFITGTNQFNYASTGTAYIASHSTLYFDKNTTFSYAPGLTRHHTLSERNLIKMADQTSRIYFDQCTVQLPDSGWQLINGSVYFDNKVTVNGNTTQATSFELGNGLVDGDMNVQLLSGAWLDNMGYIYYNPSN